MMPIVALTLSLIAATLSAQQTLPLPPHVTPSPQLVDRSGIPQQSAAELRQLNQTVSQQPTSAAPAKTDIGLPTATQPTTPEESRSKSLPMVLKKDVKAGEVLTAKDFADDKKQPADEEEMTPEKRKEIKRLSQLAAYNLQTNKAPLSDVCTLLADACQMSYVGLEKGIGGDVQISVNISKNPYETLRFLCERYSVALDYDNGIWKFGLYNDQALITRVYHLKYNNQEETSGGGSGGDSSNSIGSSSSSSSSLGGTGGTNGTSSTTSGNSSTSGTGTGTGSSGSTSVGSSSSTSFSLNRDVIKKNIETFLDMSSESANILTAEDFDVDNITHVTARGVQRILPAVGSSSSSGATATATTGTSSSGSGAATTPGKGKVIYNSDNKSLYVMATRTQHQWIEKYLSTVDKPQRQIIIETKVYETGLNLDNTLGVNIGNIDGSAGVKLQSGNTKLTANTFHSAPATTTVIQQSITTDSTGKPTVNNLSLNVPTGLNAVLDVAQMEATMQMLNTDAKTTSVQYPRQVTIANRLVVMSSQQSIPIKQASSSVNTGTGSTGSSTSVSSTNVGTSISILPRIIDGNKIQMDISINSSTVSNNVMIDSNPYPVISTRTYTTQAIIENGYSLAIGGLKQTSISDSYTGVPVLSQIPVLGAMFRNRTKSHSDTNLLIFITPRILDEYMGGVKEEPEYITPNDKRQPASRSFLGSEDESYTDVMLALAGMERRVNEFAQRTKEGFAAKDLGNRINSCENELKLMRVRVQEISLQQPDKDVTEANDKITLYLKDLNELRKTISKREAIL